MSQNSRFAVVVSFYDARPQGDLFRLVTVINRFNCKKFLVVNSDKATQMQKASAGANLVGWSVFLRPNQGMNIGAWSSTIPWLQDVDFILFLQDECMIISNDFLEAYAHELSKPNVGMTGESLNPKWNKSWEDVAQSTLNYPLSVEPSGSIITRVDFYKKCLSHWEIEHGKYASHLRALTWGFPSKVLSELESFPVGTSKEQCIAAEIAVSKKVEQLGYQVTQVHEQQFNYIQHREWRSDGLSKQASL